MANNYQQMAEEIKCPSKEAADWLEEQLRKEIDPDTEAPICEWRREDGENDILLYMDEGGNTEMLTDVLWDYLKKFNIPEPLALHWAYICDKSRPGEFGGGCVVISKDHEPHWLDLQHYAQQYMAKLTGEPLPE